MRFIYITLLITSFYYSKSIVVNVIDKEQLIPLEGANIILENNDDSIYTFGGSTNKNGNYIFKDIKEGNYLILVQYIGYADYVTEINFNDIEFYSLDVKLAIKSLLGPELNIIGGVNASYKNIPGAASIINESSMRKINPIGTQEMLQHVAGIHAFSDDGIGNSRISIGIRGLNPRRSSRVLILEDGIPIQPALYVYPNMYYNPPVERIDGIQVIKGSGVLKYGPQTMGGVINYYTRRPSTDFNGFTNITIGENSYNSLFLEFNGFGDNIMKNAFQFLYKSGDGFRENNGFVQYNSTFKTNYNLSDNKNLYSKFSMNYENSQATYTGLTEYSLETNPNFNPKEDDNFKVFRASLDFIETTQISNDLLKTRKLFGSYFDRRWWRETDVFISESNPDTIIAYDKVGDTFFDDIIRVGNGETNFGILRTFYVLGYEQSYKLDYKFFHYNSIIEYGIRAYWERFIDDKVIGDSPDARQGRFYLEPEPGDNVYDLNGNGIYEELYIHPEYNNIGDLCDTGSDGECDFIDLNNDGLYNLVEMRVGQSHHYETAALAGYLSNNTTFGNTSLNTGLRFEFFEQERIDLLNGATYLDKTSIVALPSIGFITNFDNISFFGGIHRGYTSPSSGALKVSNFALDTGLDLKAEKSWNKEIGIRSKNLFSILDFEFSIFHLNIENLVAAGRGTAFKNLGEVETMGTELSSKILLKPTRCIIHFTHTYLKTNILSGILEKYSFMGSGDPIDISGNQLPYSPENSFIIGIEYSLFNNLNLRFDYKYVDKVFTDFHNIGDSSFRGSWDNYGNIGIKGPLPNYSIVNTNIIYKPTKNIDLIVSAKNLNDEIYIGSRLHSNPNQNQADISSGIMPGPRRQINLSVKYSL